MHMAIKYFSGTILLPEFNYFEGFSNQNKIDGMVSND